MDCAAGDDHASGRDPASAWRTLGKPNQTEFAPGDAIHLKRGATCEGTLSPKGSGAAGNPITLGAYGAGAMPVVKADGQEAAVRLTDQHDWEIRDIEATGSTEYGVHVTGTGLARLRLIDCVIHGVNSTAKMTAKTSGLVVFDGELEDVAVDGVTAYDTNRWAGIILQGRRGSRSVVVRNSTVHNVYGDGIVLYALREGLIERSAAWYTGLEPSYSIGTPNSIWTWSCANCVVRETEGFYSDSPGVDGGVYDIDWGDSANLVENNYGHDSQAYCVSVFGANSVTTASDVRGNVCAGNGRSPRAALRHGDVFVYTWDKGALDGVRIHDNTLLWDPPIDSPVLKVDADFSGNGANSFDHNLIESSVPWMVEASTGGLTLDANRYVTPDDAGLRSAPKPQPLAPELAAAAIDWKALSGHYALIGFLDASPDSRGEAVVLQSAAVQYGRVLKTLTLPPSGAKTPLTFLIDPNGRMLYRWEGYAPAKEVIFAIRKLCGPQGM